MSLALRSSLLAGHGFRHGFSLRAGGVSPAPFDRLNLGRSVGDDPANVAANLARFAAEVGFDPARLYEADQVHGGAVLEVDPEVAPAAFRSQPADALLSVHTGHPVGVRVADCVSVLLADPASGAVAAAHAGWRGVVARVVEATVARLADARASAPATLLAAIFPSIGPDAFEVGDDVAGQIAAVAGAGCIARDASGRAHADLGHAVHRQLASAGLLSARIERVNGCTFADAARFFSYRRDAGRTGRHLAVIVPRC